MSIRNLPIRSLTVSFLAALCAACAPMPVGMPLSSTQAADAPSVAVGDSWTYRVRDGFTGIERRTERYRVERVGGGNITVARDDNGVAETQVYDGQWNWLKRPATNLQSFDYSPAYQAFDFPLAPGKTWHERLTATDPTDGRRFPVRIDAKAVGWERVKVPAGEFDAIKIQRYVYLDYFELGVRGASQILEYEWYAPAVKQSVRREARSRYWSFLGERETGFVRVRGVRVRDGGKDDSGPKFMEDDWLVYELVSYSAR